MIKIRECSRDDYPVLVEIWERAVRASHDFLSEDDIQEIKGKLAGEYFSNVELLCCDVDGTVAGFIGVAGETVEMLFIDADNRGKCYGSMLIDTAIRDGARFVDVNEQNPAALNFYKAKGFKIIGRSETDEAGRPFPILHLSL